MTARFRSWFALCGIPLSLLACTADQPLPMPGPDPERTPDNPPVPEMKKGALVLNEVHATNLDGLLDEDGDSEDWIEIFNPAAQPVDLSGAGLSLSKNTPYDFTFPAGAAIPARSYLVIFASKKDRAVFG